ncbi:MAG: cupin domain-containing protein [Pseudomonadota bacterium]
MDDKKDPVLNDVDVELFARGLKPAPLADRRRARIKDRLLERVQEEPSLHLVRADDGQWKTLGPGIQVKTLYRSPVNGRVTALWKVDPGVVLDGHDHDEDEECLVLEGELVVNGVAVSAGDYMLGKKGEPHPPIECPRGALLLVRGQLPEVEGLGLG